MINRLLVTALLVLSSIFTFSQTVVYSENFEGALTWTINTVTGPEDGFPNEWYISCQEDGQPAGSCGSACIINDKSLHVSTNNGLTGDVGAAYFETGAAFTGTNRRASSPDISTIGQTNLTLSFDMIGWGGNAQDYCELFYSTNGGGTWNSLAATLTSTCCLGGCTGLDQGLWQNNTYALPVACENIANLRISFVWRNVDDGIATDPSFAVDDIQITTPTVSAPVADFSASSTNICEGDCIDFSDLSTLSTNPTWAWTFTGAATTSSAAQNPTNICYNTAGIYQVELTVTDDNGTDTETKVNYITVVAAPNAGSNAAQNVCNNASLDLNTVLSGQDAGGTWTETSGTPSGQFTAGTGVLDGNGLTPGNVYTFDYTVTGTAPCSNATATVTITIVDCTSGPATDFSASQTVICEGDCIDFTDLSAYGTNPNWSWTFNGASTTSSGSQNPTNICYPTAGNYTVELTVTDDAGSDVETKTNYITVNPAPNVSVSASPNDTICLGESVTLSGSGATSYSWNNGVTDGVAFMPGSTVSYTCTGTDAGGCSDDAFITVVVNNCDSLVSIWSLPSYAICQGDCVTFTDLSTGPVSSWEWTFGGGADPDTVNIAEPTVCFDSPGIFTVNLQVIGGGDTSDFSQQITVFQPPLVTAGLDTVITLGGVVDLWTFGSGPGTWLWTPDYHLECDTCVVTSAYPYETTQYVATLTDINGCSGQDTVDVLVNFIIGVDVPSAFSPNGDGNNDVLFVKGVGIETLSFSVYNRYGQKVFETDNQNIGWDGTFQGRNENSGVFAWIVEYKMINEHSGVLKGNTTLIR